MITTPARTARPRLARLGAALAAAAALGLGLGGCAAQTGDGEQPDTRATFPAPGPRLTVHTDFGDVHVVEADTNVVTVDRRATVVGKRPQNPDWHLTGDTLDLGSGCGAGFVGLCEPRYTVTVPKGTSVDVRRDT